MHMMFPWSMSLAVGVGFVNISIDINVNDSGVAVDRAAYDEIRKYV